MRDDEDIPGAATTDVPSDSLRRTAIVGVLALVLAVLLGSFLYYADSNSDRYELRCSRGEAEPRRGLYFPWGTGAIDDEAYGMISLPEGVACSAARFGTREELDTALGTLLLEAAEHRLTQGGPEALAQARQNVEQARRLRGLTEDQGRRIEAMRADMAYHDAREILRQVERDLWQARRQLERAGSLGAGERIDDLAEWLEFVESETERFRPDLGSDEDQAPVDDPPEPPPSPPSTVTPPADPLGDVFL